MTTVEAGREIELRPQQSPVTLFGTDDPRAIVESAAAKADALAGVIRSKALSSNIQGKEYVKVEGWTLLGSMLGVFPICVWSRPIEGGWEARVEARTLDGLVVGAAEAQCCRDESLWESRPEYALRSMAQTRATSKALRSPLGFVMALAGYDTTPAEEIPHGGAIEGQARDLGPVSDVGRAPAASAARPGEVACSFCKGGCYDNTAPGQKRNPDGPDYRCKKCSAGAWIQVDGSLSWKR